MKVYAEYFEDNNLKFRTSTLLQFGDSWNLIGNIVLANPGSAEPVEDIDEVSEENLKFFYNNYRDKNDFKNGNWYEFAPDQTMHRIEKLFNGEYLNKPTNLNGVIQLFNTFNIKNQYLEEAVKQIDIKSHLLFSIGIEKYFHDKPTYFGFSKEVLNNEILKPIAKSIFDNSSSIVKKIYKQNFDDNSFYHPSYINRAINQNHFQSYRNDVLEKLRESLE